jgi:hypothetical protein
MVQKIGKKVGNVFNVAVTKAFVTVGIVGMTCLNGYVNLTTK